MPECGRCVRLVRVLATGTFDILHPGHVFYLREARRLGDELFVIVAREEMVRHKPKPLLPVSQRVEMVASLRVVDRALPGDPRDMFAPLHRIKPDIIALGYDQHFQESELEEALRERGIPARVVRIKKRLSCPLCSSAAIIRKIKTEGKPKI